LHFSIIFQSTLPSSSGLYTKTLYVLLLSPIRATCVAHLVLLEYITEYLAKRTRHEFLRYAVFSNLPYLFLVDQNIFLRNISWKTLSLCSSLDMYDQSSHTK